MDGILKVGGGLILGCLESPPQENQGHKTVLRVNQANVSNRAEPRQNGVTWEMTLTFNPLEVMT